MLAIHDPAIAAEFAVEILEAIQHHEIRARAASAKVPGSHGDKWVEPYYHPGSPQALERQALAMDMDVSLDMTLHRDIKVGKPLKFRPKAEAPRARAKRAAAKKRPMPKRK